MFGDGEDGWPVQVPAQRKRLHSLQRKSCFISVLSDRSFSLQVVFDDVLLLKLNVVVRSDAADFIERLYVPSIGRRRCSHLIVTACSLKERAKSSSKFVVGCICFLIHN